MLVTLRYLWVAVAVLSSSETHASQLQCLMRGKDMRPHLFAEVFTIDLKARRITHVGNEETSSAGWLQQSTAKRYRLTKSGPGQQYEGDDALPYWEWTIDRSTGRAKHSVWLAVHGSRSHWRGRCQLHLK